MLIRGLTLKHFRCFSSLQLAFEKPVVIITGANGSGKTSLLEALHYACYLRSFRTHVADELIKEDAAACLIKVDFEDDEQIAHEVHIGLQGKKKLIKLDRHTVGTYKQLLSLYRVVTVTADDLASIREGPEGRRTFLDHAYLLYAPAYSKTLRQFRHALESRNALLKKQNHDKESYFFWSERLWQLSHEIVQARMTLLHELQQRVEQLIIYHCGNKYTVQLVYNAKVMYQDSFAAFGQALALLLPEEYRAGRSLFGAHLDDITITFQERSTRTYGSRGQQKLVVLLMKIALVQSINAHSGSSLFVLDDITTDFDVAHISMIIPALQALNTQLIFTVPMAHTALETVLGAGTYQTISL